MRHIPENLKNVIVFVSDLMKIGFTGQLRLNFHEGNISGKVEKKESLKV